MIRTAVLLARSSLLTMLFLASALLTLVSVLANPPETTGEPGPGLADALVPVPAPKAGPRDGAAALHVALFDPGRRPDTVAGSIDDLRGVATAAPPPANVAISGVLIEGRKARAMLNVSGGPAGWATVGTEVGGWRVASIDADGAVLEHDGRSLALTVSDRWKARGQPRVAAQPAAMAPGPDPSADPLAPAEPPASPNGEGGAPTNP